MLANFHTHTVLCDGKNTPEEMVLAALENGFAALGFSAHGYTHFDLSYCVRDEAGYIAEIKRLKEKYKDHIRIYLGVEEDCLDLVNRENYEYLIGSSHYIFKDGEYYSIDSSPDTHRRCLEAFGGDPIAMAHAYYSTFVDYINKRKPDIVGHFDVITKYEEINTSIFLSNSQYNKLAEEFFQEALKSDCIFEINTGAIVRGYRTAPYPAENLLHLLKKENAKIILSSDCHNVNTLAAYFEETKALLRDIGFTHSYTFCDGKFVPMAL